MQIYSEVKNLKKVILHRPGKELENLMSKYLTDLLFDDIPYLKNAIIEHDEFSKALTDNGVQVYYLKDLLVETLKDNEVKSKFIKDFLKQSDILQRNTFNIMYEYFLNLKKEEVVDKFISGVRKEEINIKESETLKIVTDNQYPFILNPMPNTYFTRDTASVIGKGVSINSMFSKARKREAFFMDFIFKNNKNFNVKNYWYDKNEAFSIEGGDILILNEEIILIGCSQRTMPESIEKLAENIFNSNESFKKIFVVTIPDKRCFMHLDTVLTMLDYDKFIIYSDIESYTSIFELTKGLHCINKKYISSKLQAVLSKELKIDSLKFINCGDGDKIISSREQWNDGANTLAISPGKVISYDRNVITNELLDKNGIDVIAIQGSELLRGRGGPRCMSMPIDRL